MSLNSVEKAQGLRIRSQQDLAAGAFMILLGAAAFLFAWELPLGSLRQIGPGMLPKSFAVICMVFGVMLAISSLRFNGDKLQGWSWRGVLFVLGAALLFGLCIRGFDIGPIHVPALGLAVAGPVLIIVSGMAADDMKWKELIIFAIVMTTACALLFKYALSLPIPLAPWLLGI